MRHDKRQHERGQAMIEFALMLPMLIMILGGAAYFGFATTAQQRLAMGARHAARMVSIESTNGATSPQAGSAKGQSDNKYVGKLSGGRFLDLAKEMLPEFGSRLSVRPPTWDRRVKSLGSGYAALYTRSPGKSGFVVGCLFYGCTLSYELTELNWLATLMGAGFWQGGGDAGMNNKGLRISATCVMPGELPLRGQAGTTKFGIFDLNAALLQQAAEPITIDRYKRLQIVEP